MERIVNSFARGSSLRRSHYRMVELPIGVCRIRPGAVRGISRGRSDSGWLQPFVVVRRMSLPDPGYF